MTLHLQTTHGTIWTFKENLATRHDDVRVRRKEEGLFEIWTDAFNFVPWSNPSLWNKIETPAQQLDAIARRVDRFYPPSERRFLCAGCSKEFAKPQTTTVTFFVDAQSNVRPVCGPQCQEALTKSCAAEAFENRYKLVRDIAQAINRNSAENGSNTPDFLLAQMLVSTLENFDAAVKARGDWYGETLSRPGRDAGWKP